MILRKVSRKVVDQTPYEVWNAFIDLLAMEDYSKLDDVQRAAHLAFWYDSEVQNGGHLQYFENRGAGLLDETLDALRVVGGKCQYDVLKSASHKFLSRERTRIETVEQYVSTALEGEFDTFDIAYHVCEPSVQKLLDAYLCRHRDHFVEIVP